ncbi:uncharacterized protein [Choristoneura fumiferana]|uniref:uncharacterized protein n=1 Tax=Choristoneura fumiferana TaxID=7141 RepID=UPI003D15C060
MLTSKPKKKSAPTQTAADDPNRSASSGTGGTSGKRKPSLERPGSSSVPKKKNPATSPVARKLILTDLPEAMWGPQAERGIIQRKEEVPDPSDSISDIPNCYHVLGAKPFAFWFRSRNRYF